MLVKDIIYQFCNQDIEDTAFHYTCDEFIVKMKDGDGYPNDAMIFIVTDNKVQVLFDTEYDDNTILIDINEDVSVRVFEEMTFDLI